jgi:hypothetical protein
VEEDLTSKDELRPVGIINRLIEKRGYTHLGPWTFQQPWKRDVGAPHLLLLLLLLLLLVPLGEITPRWWWWRRDRWRWWWWWRRARWWWWRRTNAPLRALGLGTGLLGPTSSPLTLLGGPKQATRQRDAAGVASLPPTPRYHLGRRICLQVPCPCPWS